MIAFGNARSDAANPPPTPLAEELGVADSPDAKAKREAAKQAALAARKARKTPTEE